MIRRREKDEFWLITQDDHARLAGDVARHIGNERFSKLSPKAIDAIARHDAGWPLHDDAPTVTPGGNPLDVFESPRHVSLRVWLESGRRAAKVGPYQGLLVCLHQLSLSAISASQNPPARFDNQQLRQQFDLNKFQHAMIEHLEHQRRKLGLRTDRPLRLGLAEGWTDATEETLKFDFKLLQVMDQISLAICCTIPPHLTTFAFYTSPGGDTEQLNLDRVQTDRLRVKPWPFDVTRFDVFYTYKAIPAQTFQDDAALREAYTAAPTRRQSVSIEEG